MSQNLDPRGNPDSLQYDPFWEPEPVDVLESPLLGDAASSEMDAADRLFDGWIQSAQKSALKPVHVESKNIIFVFRRPSNGPAWEAEKANAIKFVRMVEASNSNPMFARFRDYRKIKKPTIGGAYILHSMMLGWYPPGTAVLTDDGKLELEPGTELQKPWTDVQVLRYAATLSREFEILLGAYSNRIEDEVESEEQAEINDQKKG